MLTGHAESRRPALETLRQAEVRAEPTRNSRSRGTLPEGTVVKKTGRSKNGFVPVEIELEEGEIIEGWLPRTAFTDDDEQEDSLEAPAPDTSPDPARKVVIPRDEMLMLKRESSFLYGLQAGGNYAFLQAANNPLFYNGVGFIGGGFLGIFAMKNVPVRFHINVNQYNGSGTDGISMGFNFLEIGVVPSYALGRLELSLGLQYMMAMGIGEVPPTVVLQSASELSALGFIGGAAYRFPINPMQAFLIKMQYTVSFLQSPFTIQGISLLGVLEFQG